MSSLLKTNKTRWFIFGVVFFLAFSSIVYELLLAKALSVFLGNTILHFSTTIGLYMLAMGAGSFYAEGRFARQPISTLVRIEIILTLLGGGMIVLLFLFANTLGMLAFSIATYTTIVVIGVLSGFEIPLLIKIFNEYVGKKSEENIVLGIDYLGAFVGSLFFALFFYYHTGLMASAFFVGTLNGLAGLIIFFWGNRYAQAKTPAIYGILLAVAVLLLLFCFRYADIISIYLIDAFIVSSISK